MPIDQRRTDGGGIDLAVPEFARGPEALAEASPRAAPAGAAVVDLGPRPRMTCGPRTITEYRPMFESCPVTVCMRAGNARTRLRQGRPALPRRFRDRLPRFSGRVAGTFASGAMEGGAYPAGKPHCGSRCSSPVQSRRWPGAGLRGKSVMSGALAALRARAPMQRSLGTRRESGAVSSGGS